MPMPNDTGALPSVPEPQDNGDVRGLPPRLYRQQWVWDRTIKGRRRSWFKSEVRVILYYRKRPDQGMSDRGAYRLAFRAMDEAKLDPSDHQFNWEPETDVTGEAEGAPRWVVRVSYSSSGGATRNYLYAHRRGLLWQE